MANKIRHLLHRRSLKSSPFTVNIERETLNVENPKAPLYSNIEYGELAVNYGKGHEGVFLRNSEDEVIQLNTMKHIRYDGAVDKSFEKYLDDRFVNRSGDTMYGDFTITKDWETDDPKFKYIGSSFEISGTTSISGNVSITGTITASSAIYSSDKDLKKDINNINKYDIETVADVELKSYKFIDDETKRERYGVIAQDLESVGLEHLVVKGENGKKGVDYISFLILKIAQLEKEIEELKKKMSNLTLFK